MLTRTFPENFPMFALLFLLLGAGAVSPKPVFKPRIVSVHASEFAFSAPKTVPAGTITFHLVNDGKQLHHVTSSSCCTARRRQTTSMPEASWTSAGMGGGSGGPNAAVPGRRPRHSDPRAWAVRARLLRPSPRARWRRT